MNDLIKALVNAVVERFRVLRLRREVDSIKAARYDSLAENVLGLRRAIATQERAAGDLHDQIAARDAQITALKKEYAALQARGEEGRGDLERAAQLALFRRLQSVVTQLPTLRTAVENGADISAGDVLNLLAPLDEALSDLGFEPIGQAGAEVPYDPTRHKAVGRGAGSVAPQDPVRVRYVGYTHAGEVVCKAQVTRVQTTKQEPEAV